MDVLRRGMCAVLLLLLSCASPAPARGRLLFADDFSDLAAWSIEGTGAAAAQDGTLLWDCSGAREGTAWCRTPFEGPTLITYDVQVLDGRDNINLFAYGRLEREGKEVLLETGAKRTGAYSEYHGFPNYLITYLIEDSLWRIRFRKNPGFALLSETRRSGPDPARWQTVAYRFAADGTISLAVDGALVHQWVDPRPLALTGRHGLRTWRTKLRYRAFRVYAIE
jgi:hypothetical protein